MICFSSLGVLCILVIGGFKISGSLETRLLGWATRYFYFRNPFARQLRTKILRRDVPVETFLSSILLQSIVAHVDHTNVISQSWNVLFMGGSDKTQVYFLTSS